MTKVLMFGIGGFVGKYLATEFLNHGYLVYGSDIEDKKIEGVPMITANLLNEKEVSAVIYETMPDMIVNLAAISSVGTSWSIPQYTMSVNIIGALNILEAVRELKASSKIMFIGSSEEYECSNMPINEMAPLNANNPYGISKIAQEQCAKIYREKYGMKVYCVRPFNHTGIGQSDRFVLPSFCKQVAEIEKSEQDGVIKVGNLDVERDFSDVRDVVRAYRMVIESDDSSIIYNIGTGEAKSLRDLLSYIISLSSQKIKVLVDPDRVRQIETPRVCCDYSLIKEKLGWNPLRNIYDTLREMYESYF